MQIHLINQLLYPIFNLTILISILGYGTIINYYINSTTELLKLKNLVFIYGLIIVSFFSMIINFFTPISNLLTIIIIIFGSLIYFNNFLKLNNKIKEISFLSFVVIFSCLFSLYAGVSDDFIYHYETIKNFKSKTIYEISHHRMISYNSNWLFLISIFSINYLSSTIFILSSLIYAILIFDTYTMYQKYLKNGYYLTGLFYFFILIFFLGVLNKYKDFGTDIPGVIISFYVLIIIIYYIFDKQIKNTNFILFLVLPLVVFAFIIKITNSLLFLLLFLLIINFNLRFIDYKILLFSLIFTLLWFLQNYTISGCLIWPIEITCFKNNELAIDEYYFIESFAKGDIATQMKVDGFSWIKIWAMNHFKKLIEIYLIFFLIVFLPILFFYLKKKINRKDLFINYNYLILFLLICLTNLIWFINAPAYRFGIFYNLSLIILISLPFWVKLLKFDFNFFLKYFKILTIIIFSYFFIVNINKISWYLDRYEVWPPIKNSEYIFRKNF